MRDDLLAILDAGPIDPGALAFMSRQQRKRALGGIDALIDVLDALDLDVDLEPDFDDDDADDEMSLGSPEAGFGLAFNITRIVDCGTLDQRRWAMGNTRDREEDVHDQPHDEHGQDLEPDVDDEPSLASLDRMWDQRRWNQGASWDHERDGWRRSRRAPKPYAAQPQAGALLVDRQLAAMLGGLADTWLGCVPIVGTVS